MKYENMLQAIGKTPMIKLEKFHANGGMSIFVKLEGNNPGGSIKDRAALYMIEQAEQRGDLRKGMIILEATSGNMGISLAMIGAVKGYKVRIVMSSAMTGERKVMLRALGAELILTDSRLGTRGAIDRAVDLFEESPSSYWFADQFNNEDNIRAHYNGISSEILGEVADIDYLVAGTGTSGTIVGIAERFRNDSPETRIICVVPEGGYHIQGLQNPRDDFSGRIYRDDMMDEQILVSKTEAFAMAGEIAREEGLFVGMSSGAALAAAARMADSGKTGNMVVILPDRGEKYLSTDLYA